MINESNPKWNAQIIFFQLRSYNYQFPVESISGNSHIAFFIYLRTDLKDQGWWTGSMWSLPSDRFHAGWSVTHFRASCSHMQQYIKLLQLVRTSVSNPSTERPYKRFIKLWVQATYWRICKQKKPQEHQFQENRWQYDCIKMFSFQKLRLGPHMIPSINFHFLIPIRSAEFNL